MYVCVYLSVSHYGKYLLYTARYLGGHIIILEYVFYYHKDHFLTLAFLTSKADIYVCCMCLDNKSFLREAKFVAGNG